jgi:hypothetical protein
MMMNEARAWSAMLLASSRRSGSLSAPISMEMRAAQRNGRLQGVGREGDRSGWVEEEEERDRGAA